MMSITNPKAETVRALAWDALDRRYITPRPSRLPARLNGSSETRSKRSRSGNAADNPTGPKKQKSNQVETRAVDINKPQLGAEANGTSGEKYTKGEHLQFLNSGKDGGDSSSSSSSSTLSSSSSSSSSDNDAGNAYVGSASDPIVLDDGAVAVKRETAQALDPEVSMEEDDLKVTRHSAMSAPATISPKVKSTVKTEPEYEQTAKERQEPSVVVGFKDISSCKGDTSTTESAHANVVATSDTNSQPPIEKEASTIGDYLDRCYEV